MEIEVQHRNQSSNFNNGRVKNKLKMSHKYHNKSSTDASHSDEFHNSEAVPDSVKKNKGRPSMEETRQQTDKIMNEFLRHVVSPSGIAEKIRKESRQRFEKSSSHQDPGPNKTPNAPGKRKNERRQEARMIPLRQESDDEKLYNVMHGRKLNTSRWPNEYQSDISYVSSDSGDSTLNGYKRKRNKSFSKAQRHSVVTELENKSLTKASSRRSSESIPLRHHPLYPVTSAQESYSGDVVNNNQTGSLISHERAKSDSAITNFDVNKGKHKQHLSKEKEKKNTNLWSRFFGKKKDGNKSKEDSKEWTHESEAAISTHHSHRVERKSSEKKGISREDSSTTKRRSPKLKRRISKIKRSGSKSEPLHESSKSSSRSKSLEFDIVEADYVQSNGFSDATSNSLPMDVHLSTKPPSANNKVKHSNSDMKYKEGSVDSDHFIRPNTLDIPNKKSKSTYKKIRKFIVGDSSSSSSSSDDEEEQQSQKKTQKMPSRGSASLPEDVIRRSIKHSNSDKQPAVEDVIKRYQHRATKSLSDVDPLDKNCKEIVERLKFMADITVLHYPGPDKRAQTPDSFRHHMKKDTRHGKKGKDDSHVSRAASLTTPTTKVKTHSMKTYYNMQPRKSNETQFRQHRRITRDEVEQGPSGSMDSPRLPHSVETTTWSKKIGNERVAGHSRHGMHSTIDSHESFSSDFARSPNTHNRPQFAPGTRQAQHHNHRDSPTSERKQGTPPPTLSTSPNLRASRSSNRHPGPSLDVLQHHSYHIDRSIDIDYIASSPSGQRRYHEHVNISNDIEADALPDIDDTAEMLLADEDFGRGMMGSPEVDSDTTEVIEERREEITVTEEIDNAAFFQRHPLMRQRAATTPNMPTDRDELDGDGDDDDDEGAVGGEDPEFEMDKLAEEIAGALRKRADNMKTPNIELEEAWQKDLEKYSKDKVKEIITMVASKIAHTSRNHPEIAEIALLFDMARFFCEVTRQTESVVSKLFGSIIAPLVQNIGGWPTLQYSLDESSLDEIEKEVIGFESEEPSTSAIGNHSKPPRRQSNGSDSELD